MNRNRKSVGKKSLFSISWKSLAWRFGSYWNGNCYYFHTWLIVFFINKIECMSIEMLILQTQFRWNAANWNIEVNPNKKKPRWHFNKWNWTAYWTFLFRSVYWVLLSNLEGKFAKRKRLSGDWQRNKSYDLIFEGTLTHINSNCGLLSIVCCTCGPASWAFLT